jgi:hypothetical protein
MANDETLTIALSKGRIFEQAMPLLESAGIRALDDPERSRKLILDTNDPSVKLVIIRASDVPPMSNTAPPTSASPARTCCWSMAARVCTNRWTCASPAAA